MDRFGLLGRDLEGRFRVLNVVAEGGFGVVYEATQLALDRRVALKVLKTPQHLDEAGRNQFIDKFATEGKTIARMAHPSIVQVYDFGVSTMPSGERSAWMALEWLTGTTLEAELLQTRGFSGRSTEEAFHLMKPVLDAMAFAHQNGIAHRDLKPANIMMVGSDKGPVLKVLDFGIAKLMETDEEAVGPTRTPPKLIAYSPAYAAAEQIAQARTGPWTDVHALALIFVELLTNEPPFKANDLTSLYAQIMDPTRPTPRTKHVDVGPWEGILARALAINAKERHANAAELSRALQAALNEPAGRPSGPNTPASASDGVFSQPTVIATTASPFSQTHGPAVVPTHSFRGVFIAIGAIGFIALLVVGVIAIIPSKQTGGGGGGGPVVPTSEPSMTAAPSATSVPTPPPEPSAAPAPPPSASTIVPTIATARPTAKPVPSTTPSAQPSAKKPIPVE